MYFKRLKNEDLYNFAECKIKEYTTMKNEYEKLFISLIEKILLDNNYTQENKLIFDEEYDEDERNCPSCISCDFDDDITDCFINAIWLNNGSIQVEIKAYYTAQKPKEVNFAELIDSNESEVLEYIIANINNRIVS
jgi:hypothetical protein